MTFLFSMLSYLLLELIQGTVHVEYSYQCGFRSFWEGIGLRRVASLDGSARNEEPFIINPVNRLGS